MLKRYHGDGDYIIKWDSVVLEKDLQYEEKPIAILDRDVQKLRNKEIKSVKVQWKHCPVEKALWETEKDLRDYGAARYRGTYPTIATCTCLLQLTPSAIADYANFRDSEIPKNSIFHNIPNSLDIPNYPFHVEFDYGSSTRSKSIP
ncbi:hypothetical protein MTR67_038386 [Solanum verrucosum]|uniref:Chromo domain-containing protein n=1 Tax=Solanum verrucosum TaxID=315347 RepID=A0AAF0ZMU9_SOLVR|nr:hypothetical protein MTR67_038386 [Solanum verrucosum]